MILKKKVMFMLCIKKEYLFSLKGNSFRKFNLFVPVLLKVNRQCKITRFILNAKIELIIKS